jgi:integrase
MSDSTKNIQRFSALLAIRNLKPGTIQNYVSHITNFLEIIPDPEHPTVEKAQDYLLWLKSLETPDNTIGCARAAILYYFSLILGQPLDPKQLPRPMVRNRASNLAYFTPKQALILINSCNDVRLKTAMTIAFDCGLRSSEIVNLKFSDFNPKKRTIHIRKSKRGKSRTVKYSRAARDILNHYVKACKVDRNKEWLFPGKKPGQHFTNAALTQGFKKYIQAFEFVQPNHHFHCLRHAYATYMVRKKVNPFVLQKAMGHSSIATTMIYIHLDDDDILYLPSPLDDPEDE